MKTPFAGLFSSMKCIGWGEGRMERGGEGGGGLQWTFGKMFPD